MELVYFLLVLLAVTRLFGELALRIGLPALMGELVSGVVLGIIFHSFSEQLPFLSTIADDEVFLAIADLGVFFLMLFVGLELHPRELAESSASAFFVALSGMIVPFGAGALLAYFTIPDSPFKVAQVVFVGTALAVTAVPLAVKVLMDVGMLDSRPGRIIVSAAVFDDLLSLILLAGLTALVSTGELPGALGLVAILGNILFFFGITAILGLVVLPRLASLISGLLIDELEFSALLIVGFAFSVLAEAFGMHFMLGAFVAGLYFTQRTFSREVFEDVKGKVSGVTTGFVAPIFFASIGLHLDLGAVSEVPLFLLAFILIAVVAKLIGAGGASLAAGLTTRDSLGVGFGMSARGAVELIVADVALRAGLFQVPDPPPPIVAQLFSATVIMAVLTSLVAPIAIRFLWRKTSPGT
jgi:Kef-type K+ transport system membrane component KefB